MKESSKAGEVQGKWSSSQSHIQKPQEEKCDMAKPTRKSAWLEQSELRRE